MRLSLIVSIFNRRDLFACGLKSWSQQTLPASDWELILVDDMSNEDLREVYGPYIGQLNIRHVRMDHTKHRIFHEINPGWTDGQAENWYHTPALSINLGLRLARGENIGIVQPEVVAHREAFRLGVEQAEQRQSFVFGKMILSSPNFRENYVLSGDPNFESHWNICQQDPGAIRFEDHELYWYLAFLRRDAAFAVGGVDEEYLRGVYAEDDDFKHRLRLAGWPPHLEREIRGFHLDHSHENSRRGLQQTNPRLWDRISIINRERYARWGHGRDHEYPLVANQGYDWGSMDCLAGIEDFATT